MYKFCIEVESSDDIKRYEDWCIKNAPGQWSIISFGFEIILKLIKDQDATAFSLTFGNRYD